MYSIESPLFQEVLRATNAGNFGLVCSLPETVPEGCVYIDGVLYFERFWKQKEQLNQLIQERKHLCITSLPLPNAVDSRLNPAQQAALLTIFSHHTLLLQGGPGSGKTFTLSRLIPHFSHSFQQQHNRLPRILLAAQTAKAVHHLASQLDTAFQTAVEVQTIHKLLRMRRQIAEPLPIVIDHDLVIIDESSMLDGALACRLFDAFGPLTRVIFVGDPHQLPPIEGGAPFKFLIETKPFPHHFLPGSHRAENKELIDTANALFDKIAPPFLPLSDFSIDTILHHFPRPTDSVPESFALTNYKLLSSLRIGPYGAQELSQQILQKLLLLPGRYLLVPIMITQNNEELSLFNGQEGTLIYDKKPQGPALATFPHLSQPIPRPLLPPHTYSYAISIHKSQGSEYQHVDILLPESKESLFIEHLYTAITRAKKGFRLFASPNALPL